jgi:hypothetical protein
MPTQDDQDPAELIATHYSGILLECLRTVDSLVTSCPYTAMTASVIKMQKTEALGHIDHLIVFLEGLQDRVSSVSTEVIR